MNVTEMGRVGLMGWRGTLARKAAEPAARRTRFSRSQIEAAIGGVFLALAVWQFARLMSRVIRAGRGEPLAA